MGLGLHKHKNENGEPHCGSPFSFDSIPLYEKMSVDSCTKYFGGDMRIFPSKRTNLIGTVIQGDERASDGKEVLAYDAYAYSVIRQKRKIEVILKFGKSSKGDVVQIYRNGWNMRAMTLTYDAKIKKLKQLGDDGKVHFCRLAELVGIMPDQLLKLINQRTLETVRAK